MDDHEKRRSDRVIPFVSEEEVVVVHCDGYPGVVTKMMAGSSLSTSSILLRKLFARSNPN